MACFMIGYDLNSPGQDYIALVEAIEHLGTKSWRCLNAAWLVVTDKTAVEIRDELKTYVDQSDELLIAELSGDAAWRGGDRNFGEGLKSVFGSLRV
jgi:hypothetical protein